MRNPHPLITRSNVFHFSGYWHTWSRVLTPYSESWVIELNLTPVNNDWNDVRAIVFRRHCTALDRHDLLTETLPDDIKDQIIKNISVQLLSKLITTDWLPLLDMERVERGRYGGGGLSFAQCRKVQS